MARSRTLLSAVTTSLALVSAVVVGAASSATASTPQSTALPQSVARSTGGPNGIVAGSYERTPDGAVSLYAPSYGGFSCSASRIGPQWVLTARHCAELNPSRAYTNSLTKVSGDYANVVNTYLAPSGDVALLKLDRTPAGTVLPWSATLPQRGDTMLMRGWGMDSASTSPTNLKGAHGRYDGTGTNPYYSGTDLVLTGIDGAVWRGDSGGPVTKDGVLYGALSWGTSQGTDPNGQAGYGALSPHADWIQRTTGIAPGSTGGTSTPTTSAPADSPTSTRTASTPGDGFGDQVEVTSSNWQQILAASYQRPVVLDFGATWCSACQDLKPRLERLASSNNGRWLLGEVDVDRNSALAQQYRVTAYPTVITLWQGEEVSGSRFVGSNTDSALSSYIQRMLTHAAENPGESTPPSTSTETETQTATETSTSTPTTTSTQTATETQTPGTGEVVTLTDQNYQWLIDQSKGRTVFLDFSKDGCEPCQALEPIMAAKAKQLGDQTVFGRMDGTKYPEIWAKYDNPWFPTVIAIRDGKEIARHIGYAGEAEKFNAWVDGAMKGSASSDPFVLDVDINDWPKVEEMSWRHPVIVAYYRSDGGCAQCDQNIARLKSLVAQDGGKWTLVTVDTNDPNTYKIWSHFGIQWVNSIDTYYRDELVQDRLIGYQSTEMLKKHIATTLSTHYPPKDRP